MYNLLNRCAVLISGGFIVARHDPTLYGRVKRLGTIKLPHVCRVRISEVDHQHFAIVVFVQNNGELSVVPISHHDILFRICLDLKN